MIRFEGVRKSFPDRTGTEVVALDDLNLSIEEGEIHCLIGPSGCGKTTTLRLVNRLELPDRGQVFVDGQDVSSGDVYALRKRIGYVIQSGGLFPHMTVAGNVGLLCELEGWTPKATAERVNELLTLANLPPGRFAQRFPGELSGGERQRVGLARALALDPQTILMDEPFAALDPITRKQVHQDFLALLRQVKKTVLLVTHDLDEAFKLGDRVSLMKDGALLQTGTETTFREQPATDFVQEFVTGQAQAGGQ